MVNGLDFVVLVAMNGECCQKWQKRGVRRGPVTEKKSALSTKKPKQSYTKNQPK
jgi:hypothetical protein